MVIDDRGAAGMYGFELGGQRGIANGLGIESEIELPPHALEDFHKVGGGFPRGAKPRAKEE